MLAFTSWTGICAAAGAAWLAFGASRPDPRPPRDPVVAPEPGDAVDTVRVGRFNRARTDPDDADLLAALGYVAGSREAGELVSVVLHDRERAWQGLNLYTSGHAAEAVLMDMDGQVLHRWAKDWRELGLTDVDPKDRDLAFWRRAVPLEDGRLLAIVEGIALVLLDRDSNVLWVRQNRAHHDLEVLPDGSIWVLTRRVRAVDEIHRSRRTVEDLATLLGPDGEVRKQVSILEAYRRSAFDHWRPPPGESGDIFHTNTIAVLDGTYVAQDPAFARGNLLLSLRERDLLAVLDPEAERIVWSRAGDFRRQHDPQLTADGTILLFDNHPGARRSRMLELDARTLDERRSWSGTDERPLFSATCGTVQRLPNGNTLVTESDGGRAVEVTADGEVLWEFHNPHRPPDDPALVATLFEVLRLPPDFGSGWLP